ncbi:polysaccharide deacetylase family protein [Roseixanthobacter pseudopolyaromaticivorans]|uniref:polysaccharide deacetylase family protein n=1 Tax=Xanthobacteraceae TaxID=335928 RepID=UPI00372642B9
MLTIFLGDGSYLTIRQAFDPWDPSRWGVTRVTGMRSIILAAAFVALAGAAQAAGDQPLPATDSPVLPTATSAPPATTLGAPTQPAATAAPKSNPVQAAAPALLPAAPHPASYETSAAVQPGAACPGNPDALGTSRIVKIDPKQTPFLGRLQYKQTVPLQKGEVILTFDDGPLPPMTHRVLDTLAANCVKATFFIVGRMANAYPHVLQEVHEAGHTIGTHSQTHPLIFPKLTHPAGLAEIEQGFASVNAGLAPIGAHTVPFFRFPGLGRTKFYEAYTQEHGIGVFSVDLVADDWMHLKPDEVLKRALDRLEERGSGILLLHDIQPSTAVMLPTLLHELKARGFKVVHMIYGEGPDAVAALPAPAAATVPGASSAAAKPSTAKPVAAQSTTAQPVGVQATNGASAATPAKPATAPVRSTTTAAATGGIPSARVPLPAPAPAAVQASPAPAEQPFSLSWPRILTDMLPKGLQPTQ